MRPAQELRTRIAEIWRSRRRYMTMLLAALTFAATPALAYAGPAGTGLGPLPPNTPTGEQGPGEPTLPGPYDVEGPKEGDPDLCKLDECIYLGECGPNEPVDRPAPEISDLAWCLDTVYRECPRYP